MVRGDALPSFEWRHWPQARAPLEPATLEYISRIDVFADAETLRGGGSAADANRCGGGGLGLREDCVRTMVISTMLLKAAAAAGLTLADVADIMCGPPDTGSFKRAAPAPDVAAAAAAAAASSGSGSTDRRTPFSVSPAASVDSRGRADSRGAELRSMFDAASTMLDGDETTLESPVDVINMQVDGVPEPASAATYAALRRLGAPPAAAGADDDEDDDMMGEAMPWPMGEGAGGGAGVGDGGAAEGGGPTPSSVCASRPTPRRAGAGGMLIIDAGIVDGRRESRHGGLLRRPRPTPRRRRARRRRARRRMSAAPARSAVTCCHVFPLLLLLFALLPHPLYNPYPAAWRVIPGACHPPCS